MSGLCDIAKNIIYSMTVSERYFFYVKDASGEFDFKHNELKDVRGASSLLEDIGHISSSIRYVDISRFQSQELESLLGRYIGKKQVCMDNLCDRINESIKKKPTLAFPTVSANKTNYKTA